MKKFFIAIVALAAAVSCSNDDIISIDRQAIDFGAPFVENAVRASYSDQDVLIDKFNVYGTVTGNSNTVALFGGDGATVTRDGKAYGVAWECLEKEYWIPGAKYVFQAVVDGEITVVDGKQVINYIIGQDKGGDGVSDLLYATKTVESAVANQGLVMFNFEHLLSKVGFSFENGCTNTAYDYTITSVSFTGHDTKGTYTISSGAWDSEYTAAANDAALDFSAGSATHQIIPGEQTLNITIAYDILYGDTKTKISATSVTKSLTYKFAQSTNYNIAVTIPAPGGEIKFTTTTVSEWTNAGSDIPLNFN